MKTMNSKWSKFILLALVGAGGYLAYRLIRSRYVPEVPVAPVPNGGSVARIKQTVRGSTAAPKGYQGASLPAGAVYTGRVTQTKKGFKPGTTKGTEKSDSWAEIVYSNNIVDWVPVTKAA